MTTRDLLLPANASIRAVPCPVPVTVKVTSALRHRCPFVDELDEGTVTVTWHTATRTFELHALRKWLDGFADVLASHEAVTDYIAFRLAAIPGIASVEVVTHWNTAGMEVQCATSPTPQPRGCVTP